MKRQGRCNSDWKIKNKKIKNIHVNSNVNSEQYRVNSNVNSTAWTVTWTVPREQWNRNILETLICIFQQPPTRIKTPNIQIQTIKNNQTKVNLLLDNFGYLKLSDYFSFRFFFFSCSFLSFFFFLFSFLVLFFFFLIIRIYKKDKKQHQTLCKFKNTKNTKLRTEIKLKGNK